MKTGIYKSWCKIAKENFFLLQNKLLDGRLQIKGLTGLTCLQQRPSYHFLLFSQYQLQHIKRKH